MQQEQQVKPQTVFNTNYSQNILNDDLYKEDMLSYLPIEKKYYSLKEKRFTDYHNSSTQDSFDCDNDETGFFLNNFNIYSPEIIINGELITITHETEIDLSEFENITSLYSRNGVVVDLIYQTRTIEYKIETTNNLLKQYKEAYLQAKALYEESIQTGNNVNTNKNDYLAAYAEYIKNLTKALEEGDLL